MHSDEAITFHYWAKSAVTSLGSEEGRRRRRRRKVYSELTQEEEEEEEGGDAFDRVRV